MRPLKQFAATYFLALVFASLGMSEEKKAPSLDDDWAVLLKTKIWRQEQKTDQNGLEVTTLQFSSTTEEAKDPETRRSGRTVQVIVETIERVPKFSQTATTSSYSPVVLKQQEDFRRMEFRSDNVLVRSLSRRYRLENDKLILSLATESKERDVVGEFLPAKE